MKKFGFSVMRSTLRKRARNSDGGRLERTVNWYLNNSQWWKPLRERVYGGERLGLVAMAS